MRLSTPTNSSAVNFERTTRSSVWQLMHSISGRFCSAVPGMLANHSELVSWPEMSATLASARSAPAGASAPTSTPAGAELIADGADVQSVMSRRQPAGGKDVAAGLIGDDGNGERRAVAPGAHQHALH